MAVWEKLYQLINWQNKPSRTTPLGRSKLSILDEAVDGIDDRVIELHTTVETQSTDLDNKVDKYKTITTSTDLNTILETGFYSIPDGCTNIPAMQGGGKATLIVVVHPYGASSGQVLQILVNQLNVNSTDKMYYRIGTIGTQTTSFLDWNRVLNLDDIPMIASAIKQWYTGSYTINLYGIGLPGTYYPASSTYSGNKYLDVATGKMYDCLQTGPSTYTWRQAPVVLQLKSDINVSAIEDLQEDISQPLTATGNPITIEAAEANLVECTAEVEAVQEGSGDPSPTNIRPIIGQTEVVIEDVGKNLFDKNDVIANKVPNTSGGLSDHNGIDTTEHLIPLEPSTTYSITGSTMYDFWTYDKYGNFLNSYLQEASRFTTDAQTYFIRISGNSGWQSANIQIEKGTATPYEPYAGKTYRVEIGQKNKLPMTVDGIKSANTSGTWNENVFTRNGVTFEVQTDAQGLVTSILVNGTPSTGTPLMLCANINGADYNDTILNGYPGGLSNVTLRFGEASSPYREFIDTGNGVTINELESKVDWRAYIYVNTGATISNLLIHPMLRTTIDDSEYVPYNPNLPDAIYGGELDVLTGELVVTHVKETITDGANKVGSNSVYFSKTVQANNDAWCISNVDTTVVTASQRIGINNNTIWWYGGMIKVGVSTIEDFRTWLASNPIEVVYELATPYTIQLTPQQIRLLKGTNNLSCNTGDLSIKYYPDNVLGQLKGDIESEYDERVETLETQTQELLPSLTFMSRERRNITSDLGRLSTAVAEQNLAKYGYKIGDYFTGASGYTYILADYNTFKGTSTPYCITSNHLGIVVDTHKTSQWHSGDASDVGYNGSVLNTFLKGTVLDNIKADFKALFGGSTGLEHLIAHSKLFTTALANWAWQANQYISALTCTQIDVGSQWTANGFQEGEASKSLELFRKYKWTEIFGGEYPWLRNLSNYNGGLYACTARHYGYLDGGHSVPASGFVVGLINFY